LGPHPGRRPILTLKGVAKASFATPAQKVVDGARAAADIIRVGEDPEVRHAGPTLPERPPAAALAAWKVKRAQALTWLAATHPAVFSADVKPLALGTGNSVWPAAKAAGIKRAAFNAAMKFRTGSARYLEALAAPGAMRCDLAGNAVEPVSDEHRARALEKKVELAQTRKPRSGATGLHPNEDRVTLRSRTTKGL
jgi:hypothetical protein